MSDNIDIPIEASGDDGVNRLTSAIDRLNESMTALGENSAAANLAKQMREMQSATNTALGALTMQMQEMKQVLATGFADISETNQKLISAMGNSQARGLREAGDKAVDAIKEGNAKISAAMRADANTLLQASRGMSSNVEQAFTLMFAGASPEAVREKFGAIATEAAQGMKTLEDMMQFRANAKSVAQIDYRPMAGATEAQMQEAAALNARFDAERLAAQERLGEAMARATVAELERIDTIQMKRNESARQAIEDEYRRGEAMAAAAVAELERIDTIQMKRNEEAAQARTAQERLGEAMAAATVAELERIDTIQMKRNEAARQAIEDEYRRGEAMAAATVAELERIDTIKLRRHEAAMQAIEDEKLKNVSYVTASPTSQLHTQIRAAGLQAEGLDAAQFVGPKAAADAAGKSVAGLRAELEALKAASAEGAAAQYPLTSALRQAESAFKGAAHEAGVYGLAHGQLIALLAGGAVAAALHHTAETGAEVEFQLASLNALADRTQQNPVDFDKFIGITAGTMTRLTDAAEGVHALAQAGLIQQQAFAALPDVMRLAQLGEMSVGQAAEMSVESMHAFGKSATDLGQIGDILVAVGSKSNVSVRKLAEDMKSAAVTGAMFNLNMKEITATVGALAERGLTIQPLSSALMKLYEPSDKTAKAMAQLGLTTKDSAGNLKAYTQFMGELAEKVNEFKVPADIFKQLGMSSRDSKAIEVMTQHLDSYEHLLEEANHAQGKMFDATLVKADTAEGAWKRLGSTLDGSVVKAFEAASPAVQSLEESLINMAGSDGTVKLLTQLATAAADLTKALVDNAGALGLLAAGYAGMKVVSSALAWMVAFEAAEEKRVAAATAATVATATETEGVILLANGQRAAAAGAVTLAEGTATAAVTMEGAAIAAKGLTMALGWIGVVLVTATTAYELFAKQQSTSDEQFQKALNTGTSTIDMYDQEIKRLKDLEEQLLKTGKAGVDAANDVATANIEFELGKAKADVTRLAAQAQHPGIAVSALTPGYMAPSDHALEDAQNRVKALEADLAQRDFKRNGVEALRDRVNDETAASDLRKKIDDLPAHIEAPDGASKAMREAADAAEQLHQHLISTVITGDNLVEVTKQEKQLEDMIAASKKDAPAKLAGDKDAAHARIEQLQEELRLKQELIKLDLDDAKSENKRGELGDLQMINRTLTDNQALHQKGVELARAELAAAGPLKPGQQERYSSRIKSAEQQLDHDPKNAERARQDLLDRMGTEETMYKAKTLADQGQLQDAFNLEWEAKYRKTLDNLDLDIEDKRNAAYRGELIAYKQHLLDMQAEGERVAIFKMDVNDFSADFEKLKARLSALSVGPGAGLGGQVTNAFASHDLITSSLPRLREDQAVMAADAKTPAEQKQALAALKQIEDQAKVARQIFVDLGNSISKALTDAFGKGGTALGGLVTTSMNYASTMKDIQDTLDKSDGGAAAKAAAASSIAAAQIKAYGDMTGAAKGFFDQNSNGYKVLATAEKAWRAIEIAQAVTAVAKKIMLKEGEVAATIAGDATKVASGGAASAASVADAGTEASAWGITAVVRAIASMPFPLNLVAGAATMAAVIAVGAKLTGGLSGGGAQTSAERQASQGTGTIAGDPTAKSDSIAKSLSMIESNTYNGLNVSQAMLESLQAIENSIGSFAGLLVQQGSINNPNLNLKTNNSFANALSTGGMTAVGAAAGGGLAAFTAMAALGGPIGAAIGFIVSKIPAVQHLITSIFGGKQTLDSTGFMMGPTTLAQVASQGANAQTYADITTSGGWFRSDKHNTTSDSVGDAANQQISQIITGIGSTIKTAAGLLGISGADFDAKLNGFVIDIGKIDLKGLSSADQQAAINTAFSKLSDQMTTAAVSTISQFSKAGEGALQTLTRVATDYQTVDVVFKSFGATFQQVGEGSIAAREQLIDLAGGLSKFTSSADYFLKNILSQAQQTAATRSMIDPTLAKYGLSSVGPSALKQYADLTVAFGQMGAAGAQAYTELVNLAPAMKSITDVAKGLQDQIDQLTLTQAEQDAVARSQLDPANQGLFDQLTQAKALAKARSDLVSAYDNESQRIQTAIDRLKSFSQSLHAFINSLQLGNLSPLNPTDKYGAAMAQFNDTLAKAKGGDLTAQGNLQSAAQAFLQASRDANASNSTYQADYQKVVAATNGLASWADGQVSEGQASLNALHDQVAHLANIDLGVMSVVEAINNLALVQSGGKDPQTNSSVLDKLYKELLGRPADTAGKAYWDNLLKQGVSLATIIDDIKHSTEYADYTNNHPATSSPLPSTQYGTVTAPPSTVVSPPKSSTAAPNDPTSAITALYEQILHREPDAAGLAYFVNAVNNGNSLSGVASALATSVEATPAAAAHTAAPAVTQPAPATAPAPATDPYQAIVASNAQIAAQQAITNAQLAALRTEQQTQAAQQVDATMNAGAGTADQVASAITESSRAAAWTTANKMELR